MSESVMLALIPAVSAIVTVWIQAGRKRDADDINAKINKVQAVVNEITEIGKKNNEDITKLNDGILTIERYRLEEDLQRALKRGYTTNEEVRRLSELYGSYSRLHGNGYISPLFERFLQLSVRG